MQVTADVKCYFCGHVSGQVHGERDHMERGRFEPRPGYTANPNAGKGRIRCERCNGPVFIEEVLPTEIPFSYLRSPSERQAARAKLKGAA
jgi:hypothetical protein